MVDEHLYEVDDLNERQRMDCVAQRVSSCTAGLAEEEGISGVQGRI